MSTTNAHRVYLDNAATTPVDPAVAEEMRRLMVEGFGNPSSRHEMGLEAERTLREARSSLAARLDVAADLLTFTSGGTEALALAMVGTAQTRRAPGHVLVSAIEHDAVLHTADHVLQRLGHHVERLPVDRRGWVDPAAVTERLRPETFLVAVMHVNNETGVRQPVSRIAAALDGRPDCRLLVDAVQSFGKLPTRLATLGADLLCFSAHKINGPKGVGCVARARPGLRLAPLWGGGDQEAAIRPGTENVPGIVGLARAAERFGAPGTHAETWRGHGEVLLAALRRVRPEAHPLGDADRREPHILSVAVPGIRSEILVNALSAEGIFVSSGSACHSRKTLRSPVLEALGVPRGHGVLRFSFGRLTTRDDVEHAAERLSTALARLF